MTNYKPPYIVDSNHLPTDWAASAASRVLMYPASGPPPMPVYINTDDTFVTDEMLNTPSTLIISVMENGNLSDGQKIIIKRMKSIAHRREVDQETWKDLVKKFTKA